MEIAGLVGTGGLRISDRQKIPAKAVEVLFALVPQRHKMASVLLEKAGCS